jgi:hypothetical protein
MTDNYLEDVVTNIQATLDSANEWLKTNDLLTFPVAEAAFTIYLVSKPPSSHVGGHYHSSSSGSFVSHSTNAFGQPTDKYGQAMPHDVFNKPTAPLGHYINHNNEVVPVAKPDQIKIPGVEPFNMFAPDPSLVHVFGNPSVDIATSSPQRFVYPSEIQNVGTGDNTGQVLGSDYSLSENNNLNAEDKRHGETKVEKQGKKQCIPANQKFVFANAAYYEGDYLKNKLESGSELIETYKDETLASKASIIKAKNGTPSFNIAGTANPTEEGISNFMRDCANDILIGTNNLQGVLKDRINWYIGKIEEYNRASGNKEPLILNGHSAVGSEALIVATLRPDLVSQVNMIDSPGGYDMVLRLVSGDTEKANEVYQKVEIYNGNKNFVNSIGSHPPGKVIYHIDVDKHGIVEFPEAYANKEVKKVLGRCHSDKLCNYANGGYIIERLKENVAKREISEHFGISEQQIEVIDNKSLTSEGIKKFKNWSGSKFKAKITHEEEGYTQCTE